MLTLITALMGSVAVAGLAGARRTDTAVARFLQYVGPIQGQVSTDHPATMAKIAALPDVAYSETGALMLVIPVAIDGRPISADIKGQVITQATVTRPPQARVGENSDVRSLFTAATAAMASWWPGTCGMRLNSVQPAAA